MILTVSCICGLLLILSSILGYKLYTLSAEYKVKGEIIDKKSRELEEEKERFSIEMEEALKEAEKTLEEQIKEMDDMVEDRLIDIAASNTVSFNCVCNDKPIACAIDLSEENTYRCPDCGTVYRVDIRMNPVMIGKAISDKEYIAKIKERLENEQ